MYRYVSRAMIIVSLSISSGDGELRRGLRGSSQIACIGMYQTHVSTCIRVSSCITIVAVCITMYHDVSANVSDIVSKEQIQKTQISRYGVMEGWSLNDTCIEGYRLVSTRISTVSRHESAASTDTGCE